MVEVELDLGSARKFLAHLCASAAFCIILARDSVLEDSAEVGDHVPKKVCLVLDAVRERWAEVSQALVDILDLVFNLVLNLGQIIADMGVEDTRKLAREAANSKILLIDCRINGVGGEVEAFLIESLVNLDFRVNVLLRAVLHSYVAEAQWDILPHYHSLRIRAAVHDIDLRNYTDCADALWV